MTAIEWTHRPGTTGESWNPVTGCTPISEGCANCYARRMAKRLAGRYGYPEAPHEFLVTWHPDKIERPLRWRKPRTVFVISMGDLFHQQVSDGIINRVFDMMVNRAPQHTYIVLTKRAERMAEFLQTTRWLDRGLLEGPTKNVWLGVTAENQHRADERVPWLLRTPAAVRFVSVEPMLGPVDPFDVDGHIAMQMEEANGRESLYPADVIDWVICGAETGPGARPMNLAWARDLRDQCKRAGVPYFFKRAGPGQETPPDLMVWQWPGEARDATR